MAITVTSIINELKARQFPCLFDDAQETLIIQSAIRDLSRYWPTIKLASFNTVAGRQDYQVFSPDDPVTSINGTALLAECQQIHYVYWNPGGDWSSLNIFSPGWHMLNQMILFTGSYFHQPSIMTTLRQKLDAWKRNFGSQGFEVIGVTGDASASLRVFPVPQEDNHKIVVEFSASLTLEDIPETGKLYQYLLQWAEARYSEACANYYSQTAGVEILDFKDSNSALNYWQKKAEEKMNFAINIQGAGGGIGDRT